MFHGRRNREYWKACKEVQTYAEIDIQEIPLSSPIYRKRVETFLTANGLRFEEVDSYYALLDKDGEIVAGAGLHKDVVKCVAVDSAARSGGLLAPLLSYIISHASAQGISNLKVFTKPENEGIFRSLGFHLIASAPKAILMENGHGLEDYLRTLTAAGSASGVIVMNANPFTLGHEYLVREAAQAVGRLFIIPVREEASLFPYEERLAMIKAGCGDLATVLEGSAYQISDITFPTYFLKDLSDASETQIRLDLDLFGRHIAPALGVTTRFVGSEPSDPLTARYNELMKEILPQYGVSVVEIPRFTYQNEPVSASKVREALGTGRFREAASLTPTTTWPYLVAELMSRALRMELDAPLKPGLVDLTSNGAHTDMNYALMKGSIDVIRRSFIRHFHYLTASTDTISALGKSIEADVLAFTGGVNTYRGAIFALGLASIAALESLTSAYTQEPGAHCLESGGGQMTDNQSNNQYNPDKNGGVKTRNLFIDNCLGTTATCGDRGWSSQEDFSKVVSILAEHIKPAEDSHGSKAVNEYGVKGALQMAREGYRPLFEDWLPFYRSMAPAVDASGLRPYSAAAKREWTRPGPDGTTADWRLQKTLLRIMSQLDDTCVIHRVGYERACEVKIEAKRLLENFTPEGLKEMKERYDREGISPGGSADMLALTILIDSLIFD